MSASGWNARRHGELWLGMVLTRLEDFHLALQAHEDSPTVNDLAQFDQGGPVGPVVTATGVVARVRLQLRADCGRATVIGRGERPSPRGA